MGVDPLVIVPLYVIGTVVAMYIGQKRGYWWPIGGAVGLLSGPLAPVVMFILPNRKRKRVQKAR